MDFTLLGLWQGINFRLFCFMQISKKILFIVFISFFCQKFFSQTWNGIFGEKYSQSIIISAGANYYFGDIEKVGIFSKYWKNQVNGLGQIGYVKNVFNETLRLRVNLLGGLLNGQRDISHFKTTIVEPDVILEYFPFTITKNKICDCNKKTIGLYIYSGVGFTLYSVNLHTPVKDVKYNSYVPMAALGLGYRLNILSRIELGIEFGYRSALLDELNLSLDGYPYRNDNGYMIGENTSKWNDGFYTIGIIVGYKF